ncbi:DNA double-strand break repair nuclease NurA [Halonatronum saccharophilum]|uniref:DNA double-strand break repair nuclease NurA n=1 Tax=Halonatronum saccharophilum TaxID=150060 RepID=UPI000489C028|nr:DNA double-strand break repair nuclease NurA [Halonatronum saccharophilum]
MLNTNKELQIKIEGFNQKMRQKYDGRANLSSKELKELLAKKIGKISKIDRISSKDLKEIFSAKGSLVGVDGSVNTVGKVYPHYITLMQALAKSTDQSEDGVLISQIFSPLIEEDKDRIFKIMNVANRSEAGEDSKEGKIYAQEAAGRLKSSLLAALEAKVAIESIKSWNPKVILMDGSLIRYRMQAQKEWEELSSLALDKGTLIIGVIEEIGTHKISEALDDDLPENMRDMYDRELTFGLLEVGEMLELDNIEEKEGLRTAFIRNSKDPGVIALDLLKDQSGSLELAASLVHTLTPEDGRGIPVWLDIVDEEVRIGNGMMKMLVDNHLDPKLKYRLFHSKRLDRVY